MYYEEERRLAEADRLTADAADRVARQQELVRAMRDAGGGVETAEAILAQLGRGLTELLAYRRLVLATLSRGS
jgi:hypothetical protein